VSSPRQPVDPYALPGIPPHTVEAWTRWLDPSDGTVYIATGTSNGRAWVRAINGPQAGWTFAIPTADFGRRLRRIW
jgi:hypothetical protein